MALLVTVPDEGLGCVILQNGGGEKRALMASALATVAAGLAGEPLPDAWAPPAATAIPDADRFAGTYEGDDGRALVVDAVEDGLRVTVGPVSARLERDPLAAQVGSTFLVAHPALERHPLEFRSSPDGTVAEAFHGGTWFRGERYDGPEPEEPASLSSARRAASYPHPGIRLSGSAPKRERYRASNAPQLVIRASRLKVSAK